MVLPGNPSGGISKDVIEFGEMRFAEEGRYALVAPPRVMRRNTMKKTIILAGMLAFAGSAYAQEDCATMATKVDEAMKAAAVDDATKTKAQEAADKAKAAMDAGNTAECAAGYTEALKTLGM
jgi:hypothetical protein